MSCHYDREAEGYVLSDGEPCHEPHCRVCGHVHDDGTCPECLGSIRADMREIARLCDDLPEETEHRGVNGEAMMLLGPAADPEALGHVEASIAAGRLPADYLEHADHELHPLFSLGTWDMCVRDALEHDEPDAKLTVGSAVDYLDRQLTYLGTFPHLPIEDLARDVRRTRAHLEAVLHDGEQRDTGAPCMECRTPLLRVYGGNELPWAYRDGSKPLAGEDGWACRRCKEWRNENEYRLNVSDEHREKAKWLTDTQMQERTGVKAGTVRVWASRGEVASKRDQGRTVYFVEDVESHESQRAS